MRCLVQANFSKVLANGHGQMPFTNLNPHRNTNIQGLVQEYICGQKMFFNAFATTKAVLLFRLVVIKLMFDSAQNNTCDMRILCKTNGC